ncbi:Ketoisovalerate oxidoreductase subunit VorA [Candidatus Lokiarchaeum ossiferum]|uniref:Ketoisovalerate oxidoreductase subunit VorA n=1 Tax=Candidatus Lokiarchaeum ossiferum TaxID=2951803 RepID=A0ABY6HRK0_9ARCH|nr:Ketoisovalerate oxidoreductase subunit VorA [Candidatus Lokiarchaeum sp. B-35]
MVFKEGPLKGNLAAAYAAMDADIDCVTAYPITPQTTVVEKLSELVGEKEFLDRGQKVEYIRMESEHSVGAGLVGAAFAGARTYSATAGQGLLYMSEMVHWMVGARIPVVLSIAARALTGGGWNIWADYGDIMNQRDSGILIQFLSSHQEIYDTILMSYNIAEHPDVMLPLFPAYGGFVLSHTAKPVKRISWEEAQQFVRPKTEEWPHIWVDGDRPIMSGAMIMPQTYAEFRIKAQEAQLRAKPVIKQVMADFKAKFGRSYGNGMVEPYMTDDAEVLLIGYGGIAKQAEDAVDAARKMGLKVGALRIRTYRPFPTEDILSYIRRIPVVGVVDRAIAFGNPTASPVCTDIMAVCQRDPEAKNAHIIPFVAGIGGRDTTFDQQMEQIKILFEYKDTGVEPARKHKMFGTYWTGLMTGEGEKPADFSEPYFGDI